MVNGFLPDGEDRARAGFEPQIRAQVEKEFADHLAGASSAHRGAIQREIDREVRRRLDEKLPPDVRFEHQPYAL